MSKFKELVLESLIELQEAPRAATPKYYIAVDEGRMQKYSDGVYYFYKFDAPGSDGKANPLFVPADYVNYCKSFKTEDEAVNTLNKILREFPIYDKLFGKIGIVAKTNSKTNSDIEIKTNFTTNRTNSNSIGNRFKNCE